MLCTAMWMGLRFVIQLLRNETLHVDLLYPLPQLRITLCTHKSNDLRVNMHVR